jgi:hypothetical protein
MLVLACLPPAVSAHLTPTPAALPRPIALGKLSPPFTYPMVFKATMRICAAAAALLHIKFIPALVALLDAQQLLSGSLAPYLPARVVSALVTNTCNNPELGCGAKLCSTVSAAAACLWQQQTPVHWCEILPYPDCMHCVQWLHCACAAVAVSKHTVLGESPSIRSTVLR